MHSALAEPQRQLLGILSTYALASIRPTSPSLEMHRDELDQIIPEVKDLQQVKAPSLGRGQGAGGRKPKVKAAERPHHECHMTYSHIVI